MDGVTSDQKRERRDWARDRSGVVSGLPAGAVPHGESALLERTKRLNVNNLLRVEVKLTQGKFLFDPHRSCHVTVPDISAQSPGASKSDTGSSGTRFDSDVYGSEGRRNRITEARDKIGHQHMACEAFTRRSQRGVCRQVSTEGMLEQANQVFLGCLPGRSPGHRRRYGERPAPRLADSPCRRSRTARRLKYPCLSPPGS